MPIYYNQDGTVYLGAQPSGGTVADTDTTYNGWTNYPTWNVALWLDNEEGSYELVREMARETADEEFRTSVLADNLKALHEEAMDSLGITEALGASVFSDLLGYALDSVNWHEIAKGLLDEVADEDA